MVSSVEDPHQLHRKLVDLAPMHVKKGVKAIHMPSMFRVLESVLTKVLKEEYAQKYQDAWMWVWDFLTLSMTESLSEASASGQVRHTCVLHCVLPFSHKWRGALFCGAFMATACC